MALFGGTGHGFVTLYLMLWFNHCLLMLSLWVGVIQKGGTVTTKVVDDCGNGNGGVILPVMGISLNDILGFGNGSNRDGVYSGTLF